MLYFLKIIYICISFNLKKISMKKFLFVLIGSALMGQCLAQTQDMKYRRSSLSMVLIESETFPNYDDVMASWNNYPFPDKYNKHDISLKSVNLNEISITDDDLREAGYLKDTLKALQIVKVAAGVEAGLKDIRYLNDEKTLAFELPGEAKLFDMKLQKMMKDKKLANQMLSTWFGGSDGKFDYDLVAERGLYNASESDAAIAQGTARGLAALQDAGEELIGGTFVTFTKISFYENEPVAATIRDAAIEAANSSGNPVAAAAGIKAAEALYEKTKDGYTLLSKTWLYKMTWNDSIQSVFYEKYYNNDVNQFMQSDLGNLEFVNFQKNQSIVMWSANKTQSQIIDLALVRNLDNAFAQLQKDNEVFKPKVPVLTSDPLTAQIGMKDGLKGGEKFDVLELTYNPKTEKSEYKSVGQVTADKKLVWDNRYTVGDEKPEQPVGPDGTPISGTVFKGSKKIQPGMLLKQVK